MATLDEQTLQLISSLPKRRPNPVLPAQLDALFRVLGHVTSTQQATAAEDEIWAIWMAHPNARAGRALNLATSDIAARRYDIAETRLTLLLRNCPDYAEAWNKRATLYYMLGRDDECIADIRRALALEPRHFAALAEFGEICVAHGDNRGAQLAFTAALRVNPHLANIPRTLPAADRGIQPAGDEG